MRSKVTIKKKTNPRFRTCTNLLRDLQLMLRIFVECLEVVTPLLQGRLLLKQRESVLSRLYFLGGGQVELTRQTLNLSSQLLDSVDGGHCCLRDDDEVDDDEDDDEDDYDDDDNEDSSDSPPATPRVTPASPCFSPFSVASQLPSAPRCYRE